MVSAYLEPYGYHAADEMTWKSPGRTGGAEISIKVRGHNQEGGHTWYLIECEVTCAEMLEEPLRWSVRRRLVQIREDLHDSFKAAIGEDVYGKYFVGAPFAHKGGVPGTTARL